jgi:hypothetical protein
MDNDKGVLWNSYEPEGRYADQFKIGYKECVFVLEFYQSFYNDEQERIHSRIITSPEDLKSFLELLQDSIEKYEKNHGPICIEGKKIKHIK